MANRTRFWRFDTCGLISVRLVERPAEIIGTPVTKCYSVGLR
jgi:hypothetical protein